MQPGRTGDRLQATGNRQWGLRRGSDIAERLLGLAAAAVRLAPRLPRDPAGRHVAAQLIRSATGGGANYEEARAAESRDDFAHKASVATKEVRETVFWLALIERCGWAPDQTAGLLAEANELAAILGASVRTARARAAVTPPPRR
jgi:four helix bundle protein